MDEVEVRELRYFVAVAEELNFTRAAERLGMAQPPLSAAIGKLERKLGVRLLERTTRRVALTPAGLVLLEQGRIAADGVAAAVERARRAATQAGRLTVAVKPGAGTHLLAEIIRRYSLVPGMPEAQVLFGHPGGPATAVRRGVADVAILRAPFDQRGLDSELLLTEPRIAVLPAAHFLAGRRELRRADLAGQPMPRWAGPADPAAAAYWAGTDAPPETSPAEGPEINDITQLLDAVALGDAVAYVPASTAEQYRRADLAFVPVTDLSPSQVLAAWPDTCRSPAVAAFVRAAADTAAQVADAAAQVADAAAQVADRPAQTADTAAQRAHAADKPAQTAGTAPQNADAAAHAADEPAQTAGMAPQTANAAAQTADKLAQPADAAAYAADRAVRAGAPAAG